MLLTSTSLKIPQISFSDLSLKRKFTHVLGDILGQLPIIERFGIVSNFFQCLRVLFVFDCSPLFIRFPIFIQEEFAEMLQ